MSTEDSSQTQLTQRKRELAVANFHIYNPTKPMQSPSTAGVSPVSLFVTSYKGILPRVYNTPGGVVSQPNPVASVQATIPDAPFLGSATGANLSIVLSWIPPPDSGSAITDYRYTTDTGVTKIYKTLGTTGTTATITTLSSSSATLVNGTSYTVSIVAINSIGTSIPSSTRTATPNITASTPPVLVSATPGDQLITLTWTTPTSDGGSAIREYKYTTDGGLNYRTLSTGGTTAIINTNSAGLSLVNGTPYTTAIVAVNNVSLTSTASNSLTAIPAGAPGAPTLNFATAGNQSIALAWTAPGSTGGSPITNYMYRTFTVGPYRSLGTTGTTATITTDSLGSLLVNGTSYTITIVAVNGFQITGPASDSKTATPVAVPGPPTLSAATASSESITLTWIAPASDGGSAITSYKYTTDGGLNYRLLKTGSPAATTITTNSVGATLVNGTAYTIAIVAVNAQGDSVASNSRTATPATGPGAPTLDSATAGNQSIVLVWTAPAATGGSTIIDYRYSTDGGSSYKSLGTTSPATITTLSSSTTTLVNGTAYPVTIVAVNGFQITGPASNSKTATPVSAPTAPILTAATAGSQSITLTWTTPSSDGGSAITSYRYTTNGGLNYTTLTTGSPAIITKDTATGANLVNGTAYTISIVAVNGVPLTSVASNSLSATPASAPGAPSLDSAKGGNQSITLVWTAPAATGGSTIIDYRYSTDGGSSYKSLGTTSPATITTLSSSTATLVNGTAYPVTIVAVNGFQITGPASDSKTATPATVPGAPILSAATAGSQSITLTWTAPTSDGGSAITSYKYTTNGGLNYATLTTGSPAIITKDTATGANLVNGTTYTIDMVAANNLGESVASTSRTARPMGAPDAPTSVTATAGNQFIDLAWTAPSSNGGSPISDYLYSTNNGPYKSLVTTGTSKRITTDSTASAAALLNGTAYSIRIVAVNTANLTSAASDAISATPATVPGAPTLLTATVGNQSITLGWTPPSSDGGLAISEYRYSTNGTNYLTLNRTGNTARITTDTLPTPSLLVNGRSYTITIVAVNGANLTSVASTSVTAIPAGDPTPPDAPTLLTATAGNESITLGWVAPISNGGAELIRYEYTTDGRTYLNLDTLGTTKTIITTSTGTPLVNGTSYTIAIVAVNSVNLTSAASDDITATPATVPDAPTSVTATAGNGFIDLVWTAPSLTGGPPIINYLYSTNNQPYKSLATGGTSKRITTDSTVTAGALVNGTVYSIRIIALNSANLSSVGSNPVSATPATAPTAPTSLTATAGDQFIDLTWTAPSSNGGFSITDYLYSTDNGPYKSLVTVGTNKRITTDSAATAGDLVNGRAYSIRIVAINSADLISEASTPASATPATVPDAPTSVTATAGNQFIDLAWTAPSSTGGPEIIDYLYSTNNQPYKSLATVGTTKRITTDSTTAAGILVNGTAYSIRIIAVNDANLSSTASTPVTATPATVPDAPTSVTATAGNRFIDLAWTAPSSTGGPPIADYLYSTNNGPYKSLVTTGTTKRITTDSTTAAETLVNGTTYSIRIVAINSANITGEASNPVSATPATAPTAPTSLTATGGNQYIDLSWAEPSSDGGSAITEYRYSTNGTNYLTLNRTGNNARITTDSTTAAGILVNGTSYTITIVAVNGVNLISIASTPATATPATVPDPPTSVTATAGNRFIDLTWTAPSSTGGPPIADYLYSTNNGPYKSLVTTGTTKRITTDSTTAAETLVNGTTYSIRIVAINSANITGEASNPVSATPATVPDAPTSLTSTGGDRFIDLAWTEPSSTGGPPIINYLYSTNNQPYKSLATAGTSKRITTDSTTAAGALVNGTSYTITIVAINDANLTSTASSSAIGTPDIAPDAPTLVSAIAGRQGITLAWTAPQANGGSIILEYLYSTGSGEPYKALPNTTSPATISVTSSNVPLVDDTTYIVSIKARNQLDRSVASNSIPVTTLVGEGSMVFQTGSFITSPPTPDFSMGAGNFTVECWAYITTPIPSTNTPWTGLVTVGLEQKQIAIFAGAATGGGSYNSAGMLGFIVPDVSNTGDSRYHTNEKMAANTWYHFALVRDGSNINFYVNGLNRTLYSVGQDSTLVINNANFNHSGDVNGNSGLYISNIFTTGGLNNGNNYSGSITNVRIVKGRALYTGDFRIPDIPLSSLSTTSPVSNTVLLMRAANSTNYLEDRAGHPTSATGTVSFSASAPSPAPITAPFPVKNNLTITALGNKSITVSWAAPSDGGSTITHYRYTTDNGTTYKTISTAGTSTTIDSLSVPTPTPLVNGSSYTIRIVAVNAIGPSDPSSPVSGIPDIAPGAPILDSATSSPEVITIAWTPVENGASAILEYFYSTDSGATYKALPTTTSPATISVTSSNTPLVDDTTYIVSLKARNQLDRSVASNSISVTTVVTPGSILFQSGSFLTTSSSTDFSMGSGDFTLECWAYPTATIIQSVNSVWMGLVACGTQSGQVGIYASIAGGVIGQGLITLVIPFGNGSYFINTAMAINTWYHLALVRNGSNINFYLNGLNQILYPVNVSSSVVLDNVSFNLGGTSEIYVNSDSYSQKNFQGQISNIRVVKGVAVYTKDFRVPSIPLLAVPNTVLLLTTAGRTTFLRETSSAQRTMTVTGTVSFSTSVPPPAPITAPFPNPTNLSVVLGNKKLTLLWTAPASDGGSTITDYRYTTDDETTYKTLNTIGTSAIIDSLSVSTFTPLVNGSSYTIRIVAVNRIGPSQPSPPVSGVPEWPGPTNITTTPLNKRLALSWTVPASDGGATITDYRYTTDNGTTYKSLNTALTSAIIDSLSVSTFTPLVNGSSYTIRIVAVNTTGQSDPSSPVIGIPDIVPGAPILDSAAGSREGILLAWTAPVANDSSVILEYLYSTNSGATYKALSTTTSPVMIETTSSNTPLEDETAYVVSLKARNQLDRSAASNSIPVTTPVLTGSMVFQSGSFITSPPTPDFTMGAGNFTVECWAYITTAIPSAPIPAFTPWTGLVTVGLEQKQIAIFAGAATGGGSYNTAGMFGFIVPDVSNTGDSRYHTDERMAINTWYHFALVRDGSNINFYVNGLNRTLYSVGQNSALVINNANFNHSGDVNGNSGLYIASVFTRSDQPESGNNYSGSITNVRIVKGRALYTRDFRIPDIPLSSVSTTLPVSNTVLLMRASGRATYLLDRAGHPTSATGTVSFSGSAPSSAPITVPFSIKTNLTITALGNKSITVAWAAPSEGSDGGSTITDYRYTTDNGTTYKTLNTVGTSATINSLSVPTFTPLVNGSSYTIRIVAVNAIGPSDPSSPVSGIPDIVPGAPILDSATSSPEVITIAWTPVENGASAILEYFYSTDSGATYKALSTTTSPTTISVTSSNTPIVDDTTYVVSLKARNRLDRSVASNSISVTAVVTPGSILFQSGSFLTTSSSTDFSMGSGDFTLECWAYPTATIFQSTNSSWMGLVACGTQSGQVGIYASVAGGVIGQGLITLVLPLTSDNVYYINTAMAINTWYHLALVRNGSNINFYLNGLNQTLYLLNTSSSVVLNNVSFDLGGTSEIYVNSDSYGQKYFQGLISNIRVVKGVAVYTKDFRVPSIPLTRISGASTVLLLTTAGRTTFLRETSLAQRTMTVTGTISFSTSVPPPTPVTAPFVPSNITATPSSERLTLAWTAPASDGGATITEYRYSTDNGTTYKSLNTTLTSATIDILSVSTPTPLVNGTSYTIRLVAVNSVGPSNPSSPIIGIPGGPPGYIGARYRQYLDDGTTYEPNFALAVANQQVSNFVPHPTDTAVNWSGSRIQNNGNAASNVLIYYDVAPSVLEIVRYEYSTNNQITWLQMGPAPGEPRYGREQFLTIDTGTMANFKTLGELGGGYDGDGGDPSTRNAIRYKFFIRAVNAAGPGPAIGPIPFNVGSTGIAYPNSRNTAQNSDVFYNSAGNVYNPPGPPVGPAATGGSQSIILTWTTPSNTGGSAIVDYMYSTNAVDYKTLGTTSNTKTITELSSSSAPLTSGRIYHITLVTVNQAGITSIPSSSVTATPTA